MFDIRLIITRFLLYLVDIIVPNHWKCSYCSYLELREQEVLCWKCGIGEMIYKEKIK